MATKTETGEALTFDATTLFNASSTMHPTVAAARKVVKARASAPTPTSDAATTTTDPPATPPSSTPPDAPHPTVAAAQSVLGPQWQQQQQQQTQTIVVETLATPAPRDDSHNERIPLWKWLLGLLGVGLVVGGTVAIATRPARREDEKRDEKKPRGEEGKDDER